MVAMEEVQIADPKDEMLSRAVACPEINALEAKLAKWPQQHLPLHHLMTPGLYVREIFIPKGTLCTSKIHRTTHPFVVSKGIISVWSPESGVVHYSAPFTGVTKPGTRRVLFAHEDTIWSTFHPTTETNLKRIEEQIIEPHDIPFEISEEGFAQLKAVSCTP